MSDDKPEKEKKTKLTYSGTEKAAVLLLSLGEENAAQVLKHMGPKEVQKIGLAMASLKNVEKESVEVVLDEFLEKVEDQTGIGIGTEDYIRNTLKNALGEDKAGALIDRILLGANTKGLDTLKWMDPRAVADIIRFEHPQIQSIVLSYLDPDQSAEIMGLFPEKTRLDLALRISALEAVQPNALQELNSIMEKQFSGSSSSKAAQMGGVKKVADIMNFLDTSVEGLLIENIKEVDEDLGQQIQDMMFVFDNLADVDDRGIQALLREISTDTLVLALKGSDEAIKEKIFNNMSKRAAELMKDDLEAMGPVKVSEVENSQKEILTVARRMADAGEIVLGGVGEDMI
ncbi:flagellar motor switch protein FliG [Pleionea mediterranea]|jgi:flagellar motor switch protein FliG|uniref:Flagellar motor switch protein FliG n=1 Tax=Pleionea mediterranea TaxID=523701 RepID=A0A316FKX9_9GAMM|nr:flagellar motor switch protein FliG [Pleionea mediterranea]PWK49159.1 flagellar motor switch protein FliG [Pleionea mediterranea]